MIARLYVALIGCVLIVGCTTVTTERPSWFDPKKAHHTLTADGEVRFRNVYIQDQDKSFFDFLRMRFFGDEPWADHQALASTVSVQPADLEAINHPPKQPQITWLGHSTFLLQYRGINILTDPIFSDRASPISFAGPKRLVPHTLDYALLPDIDLVVISHNHYDHLDKRTVSMLGPSVDYYVPLGLKNWFIENGVNPSRVVEMDWWDSHVTANGLRIEALPSQHWSARGLTDRFATLWASWSIAFSDFTLWFAGDTGYNAKIFQPIGAHLGKVDLALIPIGAYAPRWFMQAFHVNPEEALLIHKDVNAEHSIGMHWGTFPLTAEPPAEPVEKLSKAIQQSDVDEEAFSVLSIGESQVLID